MIELQANDWYLTGRRGVAFSFTPDKLPSHLRHPRDMVGMVILVNGLRGKVIGVEHWAIECPQFDERCPHPFGLLIEPARHDD